MPRDSHPSLAPLRHVVDPRRAHARLHATALFVGCVAWLVGAAGVVLAEGAARVPSTDSLVVAACCTALAVAFSRLRHEFVHDRQSIVVAPDTGFLVLAAVVVAPAFAAVAGGLGVLASLRSSATRLERVFIASSAAFATGAASLAAHRALGDALTDPRFVLLAAGIAALVRTLVLLAGQLLVAESRTIGGALVVLRGLPVRSLVALDVGLPAATVAMSGPFLDTPPLAMLVVLCGQLLTWRILHLQHAQFRDSQVGEELLTTFRRYVPTHVADAILDRRDTDGADGFGADQRDVTVLFVDIRGFTSWSERTAPSEVLGELNRLLGDLVEGVLATGGTLDKFTGDGLMAFWNAPRFQEDHALRAVQCLPKLLMRLREFNIRREVQRLEPLQVGIGIASGPAMVGTVGHRERLAYTAIGDTVNRAARLEQATKARDVPVLVDEQTFLRLPASVQRQFTRLEGIAVKGRVERIRVYAPTALASARPDAA